MTNRAIRYEKLGMDFGDAMRLSNLERLKSITSLSTGEERELEELKAALKKLGDKK